MFSKEIKIYEYVNIVYTMAGKNSTTVKMAQIKMTQVIMAWVIMAQLVK